MFSVLRNPFIQNLIKPKPLGEHLVQLRCITRSSELSSSYCLKKKTDAPKISESLLRNTTRASFSSIQYVPDSYSAASQEFNSFHNDMVRELQHKAAIYDNYESEDHIRRVLHYNTSYGMKTRGILTASTYKMIAPKTDQTEPNLRLANYLGWCIEMLQATLYIVDDMIDGSNVRMSRLCWHKHDDVQINAINDAFMIENGIYQILKMEFSTYKFYAKLLELFREGTFIATLGQKMNIKLSNTKEMNFTLDQYKAMAINKTAWYSFYMPVACAMHLAGYKDESEFSQTKNVLLEIGQLFQVQDDYLDCYGDPTERGTIGRDIEDGRFTWLLLTFLEHATDAQKAALKEAYGKKDPKSVERVKQLYNDVSLPKIYANYEEEAYKKIETKIKETTRGVPAEVYYMFLDSLFKRTS